METINGLSLRLEQATDYQAVEILTREAFWNVNFPGCDEHYLVHILRDAASFIPALDYVALQGTQLVGNIMYAHSVIRDDHQQDHPIITFGPVSVLPIVQKQGIGKALITHTIHQAREMGYRVIAIYGRPEYYCQFGFVAAEEYGIRTKDSYFSPALQILELVPGALQGINGRFIEDSVYELDPEAAEAFESTFPPKEKQVTPSQARFQELLSLSHL